MRTTPLPDLALSLRQQSDVLRLRAALQTSGTEVTTGLKSDISENGSGLVSALFGIDRNLDRLEKITFGLNRAGAEAAAVQAALEVMQEASGNLGLNLMAGISRGDAVATPAFVRAADQVLTQMSGALNTRFGGKALFSGTATDRTALEHMDTFVADIAALVAAAPDAATAFADIDAYMTDPGGGFETNVYAGTGQDQTGAALPDGTRALAPPRADDPAIRTILGAVAAIAAMEAPSFGGDPAEQRAFVTEAADRLQIASGEVITMRALFGQTEQRIADGLDQAEVERTSLRMTRNDLAGKDPYVAATEFAALEGQLETMFAVTARLGSLSLTNFLR